MFRNCIFRRSLRNFSSSRVIMNIPQIHPLLLKRAEVMKGELKTLEDKMSDGFDEAVNKKFAHVGSILENYDQFNENLDTIKGLKEIQDPELVQEAEEELKELIPQVIASSQKLQTQLLPPVEHSDNACILELRPGVGGSEAALFTKDLSQMYQNYAGHMRWKFQIIQESVGNSGAVNEVIISIDEPGSYNELRHESGIHRVQRVPSTEAKGRIHTSTAAVVVLPKLSEGNEKSMVEDEKQFGPNEIRIDTMRAGGKGGQHVNTTDSAVRIVHNPTGITVVQQSERSQPRNKAKALTILRSRLALIDKEKELEQQRKIRTDQVSTTDRSDKIRTYNYPQNRVTDHRPNYSLHDIDGCMGGYKLNDIIEKVKQYDFENRLQEMIEESKE